MGVSALLWSATLPDLKRGYVQQQDQYVCLLCGRKAEKGIVYSEGGVFYEAERYMRLHVEKAHDSVFAYLISLDKKVTGLSEHQNQLVRLFHQGKSDGEIQREMAIGSVSTVRNHRFILREKERQAKVFLALMELVRENAKRFAVAKTPVEINDEQFVTEEERQGILKKYFPGGGLGMLKTLTMKEKHRVVVLQEIAKQFVAGRIYNENEVNEILALIHSEYVVLRRYLIEYGLMDRKPDGSEYWLKEPHGEGEVVVMDRNRKKQLKQEYKEMKTEAGVYQIRNTRNEKVFIISTPNLKTMNGQRAQLEGGKYRNRILQKEWNEYGKDAFAFEVLEILEQREEGYFDLRDELKKLEQKWLDKKEPYGEHGYH